MMKQPISWLAAALLALPAVAQVKITPGAEKIAVEINGQPYTDFYVAGAGVTKPYLHPLRAASGTYVTRMWPMEKVAEEASIAKPDHQHQRGVWFAHDTVIAHGAKLDFWNNEADYTTDDRGKIVLQKVDRVTNGKDQGSLAATFAWTDWSGRNTALTESRVMTFYADPKLRIVDFDITLSPVDKVTFGDGKDGLFGIRIRPVLQERRGNGHIVTADGLETENKAWGKRGNWCDYAGEVNGEKVGIAILDHPQNPHHPARWHVRGYGLFAANPFLAAFTDEKSPDGAVTLERGQSLRFRYRVIVHPGDVKTAGIADQWERYIAGR
jgi:hypothetical protein